MAERTPGDVPTSPPSRGRVPSLEVVDVSLACCALEARAARVVAPAPGDGPTGSDESEPVTVLVVAGTVTNALAASVRARYDAITGPKRVVSFGACANSGGPYWDSYSVTPGVDRVVPVDVVVPGCPPRPDALTEAIGLVRRENP